MRTSSSSSIRTPLPAHPSQDGTAEFEARYPSRRKFLEHTQLGPAVCRVFWPCYPQVAAGRPVVLHVRFGSEAESFAIRGRVLRARDDLRDPRGSGLLVEVTGADLFDFGRAYAHASGRPQALGRRRAPRVAASFAGRIVQEQATRAAHLSDLSMGGAFVALAGRAPPAGTRLRLELKVGWLRRVTFTARVAWVGQRDGVAGMGVEFVDSDVRARGWLITQMRSLDPSAS